MKKHFVLFPNFVLIITTIVLQILLMYFEDLIYNDIQIFFAAIFMAPSTLLFVFFLLLSSFRKCDIIIFSIMYRITQAVSTFYLLAFVKGMLDGSNVGIIGGFISIELTRTCSTIVIFSSCQLISSFAIAIFTINNYFNNKAGKENRRRPSTRRI